MSATTPLVSSRPGVFLSYARSDDGKPFDPSSSFVARFHRDLTAAGFDVWFHRVSMPSPLLTIHQEIRDALATCDRLVPKGADLLQEELAARRADEFIVN